MIQGNTKPLAFSILAFGILAIIVIESFASQGVERNISEISSKMRDTQAT